MTPGSRAPLPRVMGLLPSLLLVPVGGEEVGDGEGVMR
jgi:hypothetical protein